MALIRYERETTINFNEDEDTVYIYTDSPVVKRYCDKLGLEYERKPDINRKHGMGKDEEVAWWYQIPKKEFRWGKKRKVVMSAERKEEYRQRMYDNVHAKKS